LMDVVPWGRSMEIAANIPKAVTRKIMEATITSTIDANPSFLRIFSISRL